MAVRDRLSDFVKSGPRRTEDTLPSTFRYEHDSPKREVAERFLRDVRAAVAWIRPKIVTR
jgi:hypothetical protein